MSRLAKVPSMSTTKGFRLMRISSIVFGDVLVVGRLRMIVLASHGAHVSAVATVPVD